MEKHSRVRVKDLARELNLSSSTVSLVLNGRAEKNRIPPETRELVLSKAAEMGYQAHRRNPSKQSRVCIGFFLPQDIVQGPIKQIMQGISLYRSRSGAEEEEDFMIVVYNHGNLHKKQHLLQGDGNLSGAIIVGTQETDIRFLRDFQSAIPLVLVNRESPGCYSVMIDDYEVGQSAARHFLKRGHRNLALIAPTYTSKSLGLRITGFLDCLRECANILDEEAFANRSDNSPQGGHMAVEAALTRNPRITALFITNDSMVPGVVHALRSSGRRIPEDVEVISFGDMELDQWSEPPITSFAYPVDEMIYDAIRIMMQALSDEHMRPVTRHYSAECVFRTSCPKEGSFHSAGNE